MRQRDWHSARTSLDELLTKLPRDGEAHLKLATVYGELDSVHQMLLTLERARNLSPRFVEPANLIAERFWFKNFNQGLKHLEREQYDEAAASFRRAVQIAPDNRHSLARYAEALQQGARYEEAERIYTRLLANDPTDLTVKAGLAEIYFAQKRFDESIEMCDQILASKPFDLQALKRRAYALLEQQAYDEAEIDFQLLVSIHPTADLLTELGRLYMQTRQYEKAIDRFIEALGLNPKRAELYRDLGEANWRLGNYREMARWYQLLVEDLPNDLQGWKNLALAYEALGQAQLLDLARTRIHALTGTN